MPIPSLGLLRFYSCKIMYRTFNGFILSTSEYKWRFSRARAPINRTPVSWFYCSHKKVGYLSVSNVRNGCRSARWRPLVYWVTLFILYSKGGKFAASCGRSTVKKFSASGSLSPDPWPGAADPWPGTLLPPAPPDAPSINSRSLCAPTPRLTHTGTFSVHFSTVWYCDVHGSVTVIS